MPETEFIEELVDFVIQCDEERLQHHLEFVSDFLMDWLYPKQGSELN